MLKARAITHATPGETPSGTHMGRLIDALGIADAMKGRVVHRSALRGGIELVANGEAELGFYPKSEVLDPRLSLVGPLPDTIQLTTIYGAGVTAKSGASDAAVAFTAFIADPKNRTVWTQGGFDPPMK